MYGLNGCYQCPDRHVGCHSDCEKYREFTARKEEIKAVRGTVLGTEHINYLRDRQQKRQHAQKQKGERIK